MRVIAIGRDLENDIVIPDPKVSRTHLQIVFNGSICSVVDLNSTNGTYVNGRKITSEVRLQASDTVCIGDTILPWQTYLNQETEIPTNGVSTKQIESKLKRDPVTESPSIGASAESNRMMLWIALTVTIAIILGGTAFWVYYYQNKEKCEIIKKNEEKELRHKQETEQNEKIRLEEIAVEEQYRQALREDRTNSKELAEQKIQEAKKANDEKIKAQMDAEAANNAAAEAKVRVDKAEEAKAQALNAAQQAQQDKDKGIQDAQAKADKAISAANEKVRLTEQFYEEYSEMDQNLAKQICDALKIEIPKDTIVRNGKSTKSTVDAKTVLKRAFSNFDNKSKQKIINEIHQAKKK